MEAFYRKIYLFRAFGYEPIKIARNSQLPITVEFADYTIPEGAKASAFSSGSNSETIYTQPCTVSGNTLTFTPEPGFFAPGKNILQFEINNSVIPLALGVKCEISLPDIEDVSSPESVKPYVIRAEEAAVKSEAAAARAEEVKKSIPDDYTELENSVKQAKGDIKQLAPAIAGDASGTVISLDDAGNRPMLGLTIYGRTTQDGTPTPDAPVDLVSVGDGGSVGVTVVGRNLLDVLNENLSVLRNGVTATAYPTIVNDDGTITINVSGTISYGQGFLKKLLAGQTVTISFSIYNFGNGGGLTFRIFDINDYTAYKVSKTETTTGEFSYVFTPTVDSTYMFGWYVSLGTAPCGAQIKNLQFEFGSMATAYEPYKDGGSVRILTPNGLPGIPVTSGGNYTDENCQQWICDEVDFERGVYVQRIGKKTISDATWGYNGTNFYSLSFNDRMDGTFNIMCSHYAVSSESFSSADKICRGNARNTDVYIKDSDFASVEELKNAVGNGVIFYVLAAPIETALSCEEVASYADLHTNKPNTTIYNDAGAWMAVGYNVDTKQYVDAVREDLADDVDNSLKSKGILPNGQDMDTLIERGIYIKSENRTWANYPSGLTEKSYIPVVMVMHYRDIDHVEGGITQVMFHNISGIFWRNGMHDGTWGSWRNHPLDNRVNSYDGIQMTEDTMKIIQLINLCKTQSVSAYGDGVETGIIDIKSIGTNGNASTYRYLGEGSAMSGLLYSGMVHVGNDALFNRNLETYFSAIKNPASVMYTEPIAEGNYQGAYYGAICSSFAGWVTGQDRYIGCVHLSTGNYVDFYDYCGLSSIRSGDCLLSSDETHIKVIVGLMIGSDNCAAKLMIIEQGRTSIAVIDENELLDLINNHGYKLCRYKNTKIREIPPIRYAEDVISNRGNNTFFYSDEEIWLYVPTGDTLYYRKSTSNAYDSVSVSALPSKSVNGVTVYNVTGITSDSGRYYFTTVQDKLTQCYFDRIDVGNVTVNNKTVTLSGYSENVRPLYYQIMMLYQYSAPQTSTVYNHPDGYKASIYDCGYPYVENDTFEISPSDAWDGYYVRVFYKTETGTAYKDSDFILY